MFVQVHWLTFYPPSNLNRDELGRPKTAIVGDTPRLRISSQSLKRAWRTSTVFESELAGHLGKRTKRIGVEAQIALLKRGIPQKEAEKWATKIAAVFGAVSKKDPPAIEQLAHVSPAERHAIDALVETLAKRKSEPTEEELKLLRKDATAVDIAMFGRMLADATEFNVDAAVQVAHAFTVHPVTVEEDYFTAVDDLRPASKDAGAGHVGVSEFGSGIFYGYVCIDRKGLVENLGDEALAQRAITALVEAIATVGPSGKQNSYASRANASYVLVEKGSAQPRSLALAFLDGIRRQPDVSLMNASIEALRENLARLDKAYGASVERQEMDVAAGTGSLTELKSFAAR